MLVDGVSCGAVVVLLVDGVADGLLVDGDELGCDAGVCVLVRGVAVAGELPAATAATPTEAVAPPATRIQVMARARARPASALREVMGSLRF